MTKNKNQKKKAAAAVVAKKNNNNNNSPPNGVLTPPGTPPSSNGVGSKPTPGTYLNGMARKPPVPWEREFIGTFLLEMADRQVISARSEWYVDKTKMRQMFEAHLASHSQSSEVRLKLSIQGAWNIGSLLHRTNFLINTPRGNNNYRIKNFALMEFRKEKFNLMDENHRQRDASALSMATASGGVSLKGNGGVITEEYKLDSEAPAIILKYQKTQEQMPKNFELDSMGCYICQVNFETIEKYEEHVEYHGDESDFSSLKKMKKLSSPKLTLSYQTCVDSHYFGFTLKTKFKGLVVHKFIIVQLRQFFYVNNARMPLEVSESGELIFFVDSHVFMILREMPIVIGFTCNGTRYVEQHHFMRTEALPKASFNINPYRLSSNETFKSQRLDPANPPTEVLHALKHEDAQVRLADFDKQYRDFCERGRDLTQQNISGTLRTLLQVEDIERLQHYLSLKQSKMELHQFGRELSVKLQQSANSMGVEDIVSPGDDVLIINERGSPEGGVRQLLESNNQVLELALKDFDAIVQWGRTVDERFGSLDKSCRVFFARILGVSTQRVNITCERQLADNTTYTLIFRPLRAVMRYQYRALQQLALTRAEDVQRILFPSDIPHESVPLGGALRLNNGRIASNPEQLDAVKQIALCKKLPAPYIVFGPPGTGKTATICEAIYQLYVNRPETNILVVAGSNTACDEVALRLLQAIAKAPESQPRPLARIFAASCDRRIDNIDDLLLEYSNMYSVHFYPAVQALHQYRIVVCTLSLAGKLSTGGFARGDIFSHVFLDEAAASTEAEALMAITCTMSPSSNLILSGDHKQLGPVLQSQRATEWGLDVSLFERLLERKCYKVGEDGSYNKAIQTRLIRNFRSHPEIVSLYSELYYDGKLKAQAPMDAVCRFKTWFHTPNADFPIMFHSVFGTVMNTKSSVSLCNNKEIDAVMDYVKDLMYFGLDGEKVSQSDIGVISPYKSQYLRIQEQLNMRNWSQIDCGSVELFQGKEKQVIIVSFVRSFTPKLGFLNSQRRLNVLLSRPMSLLILIGNPRTLSQNNDFRRIIEMCRDRKTLVGMPYFREEVNCQNKQNATPGGAGRTGAAGAAGAVGAAVMHPKPAAATPPGLGQTLKRTASNAKNPAEAVKLFYNKEELLQLGTRSKAVHRTELDKIFDELPQVPGQRSRYVNHNCDATRAVTAQLKDLKLEVQGQGKGSTSTAPSKHPKPLNLPVNTPFRLPSDENTSNYINQLPPFKGEKKPTASKPVSIKAMPSIRSEQKPTASKPMSIPGPSTFRGEQRYINGVPCGIEVPYHQPSAPPMSPPKTTYSYIPNENHRFENMRPMSDEYRRPPPFYEPHRWAQAERPPTPPPATEKKSKCVIS